MPDLDAHLILYFLCVLASVCTFVSGQTVGSTPWDTLNTTFPSFIGVPLTITEAESDGWTSILSCGDEGSPGNVYWYNNDFASMPVFNADGNIAGIIVGIKDPGASQHGRAPWMEYTYSSVDSSGSTSTSTFYGIEGIFRDPDTICTSGSTGDVSFGDRLWIANGSHTQYTKIPLNESYCALANQGWDQGGCKDGFFKMGVHYWRYNSVYLNCNESYPIFVLYDNHVLHAWGVAMGNYDRPIPNSTRWEHPQGSFLTSFFLQGEAPNCLAAQSEVFNSLHVYMTSSVLVEATECNETDNVINQEKAITDCESIHGEFGSDFDWALVGVICAVAVVGLVTLIVVVWKCRYRLKCCRKQMRITPGGKEPLL